MPNDNINRRRPDMSDLMGTDDIPLDEEYFEEKLKNMGDERKPSAVRRMKLKKPEENALLMSDRNDDREHVLRNSREQELFGVGDIDLSEEYFEEKIKAMEEAEKNAPEKPKTEYEQWLEEGLKKDKGYGVKESYEGDTEPEADSYRDSTYEHYDKWQAETQQLIRNLKARDARNKARDDNLNDMMYVGGILKGGSGTEHPGDPQRFFDMLIHGAWFMISSLAVAGVFFGFGARGYDLLVPFGLGTVVGAIVRYNGKEGYTMTEALQHGSVEIAILVATLISWMISLIFGGNMILFTLLGGACAIVGEYIKQRVFMARSSSESFHKAATFALIDMLAVSVVIIIVLIRMMQNK